MNHSQNSTTTPATSGAHVRRLVGTTAAVLTGVALAAAAGTTAHATASLSAATFASVDAVSLIAPAADGIAPGADGIAPAADGIAPGATAAAVVDGTPVAHGATLPVTVGQSLDVVFGAPRGGAPATFPAGVYWVRTAADLDGDPRTDDVEYTYAEHELRAAGPLQVTVDVANPAGARYTLDLMDLGPQALIDHVPGGDIERILDLSGEPLATMHLAATAPAAPLTGQFHFAGHRAPAPFSAAPAGTPATDVAVGDWDGDGVATPGVRTGNTFSLLPALKASAGTPVAYGRPGDVVHVGDWDGDGIESFGVRRGNEFHLTNGFAGGAADTVTAYGRADDEVLIGDWDGDGIETPGVRRGNTFYLKNDFSGGPADVVTAFGRAGDEVVIGDWDGDSTATPGVRRGTTYHLIDTFDGGAATTVFDFGAPGDAVLVGDWTGAGKDAIGIYRR